MVDGEKNDEDTGREDPPEDQNDDDGDADESDEDGKDDAPKQTDGEKKLAEALRKARAERNEARRALAEARKAADGKKDDDSAGSKAAEERVEALERALVTRNATAELIAAGLDKAAAARAVRLLDLTDVGPDDDLADQIDELKDDFPELFAGRKGSSSSSAPPVRRADGGDGRRSNGKTPEQRFTDRLMRQGGYR